MEDVDDSLEIIDELDEDIDLSGKRNINFTQKDSDIDGLYRQYQKGRLIVHPPYQRKFVWDAKRSSLIIESILMNIPVPILYFATTDDDKINVIDGQQRLISIFGYIEGFLPDNQQKKFKLTGLNVFKELNGKTFKELDEKIQNKILDYSFRTITFTSDSDPDLQYEIFSRLNTGSVALNAQELRNCIYKGRFNDLLKELAADPKYLALFGWKKPHKRMKDVELVLRFTAFYQRSYHNYKSPIKQFLNDTMERNKNIDDKEIREIRNAFKRAVTNLTSLLGVNSFRRFKKEGKDGVWENNQINIALFDILMDSMARLDSTVLMRHLDSVKNAYIDLMVSNQEFMDSIILNTSDTAVVKRRFEIWNNVLSSIIKNDNKEPRCFPKALKQKLFDENPTCAICNQNINSIDDAAVDHINQYWMGGRTIPDNARLVHRFCNMSRSRNDK